MLQTAVLCLLLGSAHSFTVARNTFDQNEESSDSTMEEEDVSISTLLEKANKNLGKNVDGPLVVEGDIVLPYGLQNADPCTARGCLWPKSSDGNVYVPFRISRQYSQRERRTIVNGLNSFAQSTCIRFIPLDVQQDFLDIQSRDGCFSSLGRRGRGQVLSLARRGCVFQSTIQHELLHALGFHHEQTRSDRDQHVRILTQNITPGFQSQFRKIETRNLGTPYDYGSVMHYGRTAFSRNGRDTIVPIPDPNVSIGRAREMSPTDILRVNRLYNCNATLYENDAMPEDTDIFL